MSAKLPLMNIEDHIAQANATRWTADQAWAWHNERPWKVGCNYMASTAINQLEMWQSDTFDLKTIDRELGWLSAVGINSIRVFLHDLLWTDKPDGFLERIEQFLKIADRHNISTLFVFFDSCWFPFPRAGKQCEPEPGVHNSYWLQSPGVPIIRNPEAFAKLAPYVTTVVKHFRTDRRIEGWDVWNEPENANGVSYSCRDLGKEKATYVLPLLIKAFEWIRVARPMQPVTSGLFCGDWSDPEKMEPLHRFQIHASDIISFHRYQPLEETMSGVRELQRFGRPLMCTEYMARPRGSTFADILPFFKKEKIGAYNWGSIAGRSQTIYPWDSWQNPYPPEPPLWFHDIFRNDGRPYDQKEVNLIRSLTEPRNN